MCLKAKLLKALNILWPILEGEPIIFNRFIQENEVPIKVSEKDYNCAYQMYLNQKERIKTIESKSMIFIGIFGSLIALLSFIVKDLIMSQQKTIYTYIAIIVVSLLVIYSSQVLQYSIKALERRKYYSFSYDDFLEKNNRETVLSIITKVQKNYDEINSKVDNMTLAQDFMKRVISLILLSSISLLVYGVWIIMTEYISLNNLISFILQHPFYFLIPMIFVSFFLINLKTNRINKRLKNLERIVNKKNEVNG